MLQHSHADLFSTGPDYSGQVRFFSISISSYILDRKRKSDFACPQTALHFTASKNNLETARKLISHGATARVKDKRGQLPLHRAAAIGSVPMVNLMLENKSPLNASDISGLTALHHGKHAFCSRGARKYFILIIVSHLGGSWRHCFAIAKSRR